MPYSFFLFGAGGYIGGAVLLGLKRKYHDAHITVLVRNENELPIFEAMGVKILHSSGTDRELLINHFSEHHYDCVINCASADGLELAQNILAALKSRKELTGKVQNYLHSSGSGVVSDEPTGNFQKTAEKIWDDANPEDIKSIAPTQPHRSVDLAIFEAANAGHVNAYIVAPSTIYGTAHNNPIRKYSDQVPNVIRYGLLSKQVGIVGEGTNVWNHVHYLDIVELYLVVLAHLLTTSTYPGPYESFFWGENGTHIWGEIDQKIAQILYNHPKKLVTSPELRRVDLKDFPLLMGESTNSRIVANRGRALGWKPKQKGIEDALEEDVEAIVDEFLAGKAGPTVAAKTSDFEAGRR